MAAHSDPGGEGDSPSVAQMIGALCAALSDVGDLPAEARPLSGALADRAELRARLRRSRVRLARVEAQIAALETELAVLRRGVRP